MSKQLDALYHELEIVCRSDKQLTVYWNGGDLFDEEGSPFTKDGIVRYIAFLIETDSAHIDDRIEKKFLKVWNEIKEIEGEEKK